jgi:CRISPR/Cas system CSM-associated protein Csm3 (group 7 of RAMP superfamily)
MIQLTNLTPATTDVITLRAIVDSALCVGAGGSSGSLADKPLLKTATGHLVIPASQLKGRLRHECEKLTRGLQWPTCTSPVAETMCPQVGLSNPDFHISDYDLDLTFANGDPQHHCLICQIFGNPALPARLQVSDLVCTTPPAEIPEVLRPGVSINRRRRTAEEKKLYFLETSPVNTALEFSGNLTLAPDCPEFAKALILAGLHHIHALGGSKSAGLGWLHWDFPRPPDLTIDSQVWDFLGRSGTSASTAQPTVATEGTP